MNRRQLFPLLAGVPVLISGCGSTTFRYKLTLALETPDGVKRASSVTEVRYQPALIPSGIPGPIPTKIDGEALYLDLGPGRRPLIALRGWINDVAEHLYHRFIVSPAWGQYYVSPCFMAKLYGDKTCSADLEAAAKYSRHRGAKSLKTSELPNLVTFEDVRDPKSVMLVNPDKPSDALGQPVRWHTITIEFTDEPPTRGIDKNLPWLKGMRWARLDGSQTMTNAPASKIDTSYFWEWERH